LVRFLEDHIESVHKKVKNYLCDLCGHACYKQKAIELHILNCHLPKNVKCPQCDFTTITKERLNLHIKNIHEEPSGSSKKYQCPVEHCKKILKKKSTYDSHLQRVHHREENKVKCDHPECTKLFYSQKEMGHHFERVHSPRNEICDACGGRFGSAEALRKHFIALHREKKFACEFCGDKFVIKSRLQMHIKRNHTFEKNIKCTEPNCEAAFYKNTDLVQHISKVHRGIRFNCQVPGCLSSLSRRDAYINHLKSHKELTRAEFDELFEKLNKFCREMK
jgi:uncharacterized Zn-finger protein